MNFDLEIWSAFSENSVGMTSKEFSKVISNKSLQSEILAIHKKNLDAITKSHTNSEVMFNLKTSEKNKAFLTNIADQYVQRKSRGAFLGEKATFFNKKIESLIGSKENIAKDDEISVVFLTDLKHSDYYWNN